jgi:hypothetical protein
MTQELTRDDYAACVNMDFIVDLSPEQKVTMKLSEVTELKERFSQQTFSLIFHAPETTPIEQGQFTVHNEKLGDIDLFMVPIGKDKRGVMFQSLFNRLIDE